MRLIVRGPVNFKDYSFVKENLDKLTKNAKDIVLISDHRIDHEHSQEPSTFPLAERWESKEVLQDHSVLRALLRREAVDKRA
jgi:hypothetical protein